MASKQKNVSPRPVEVPEGPAIPAEDGYPTRTKRQDLVFAVKFFGIAALVILGFWWLDWVVR